MVQKIFRAFGTVNMITVFEKEKESVLDIVEERIKQMDTHWSVFRKESDISQINRSAGKEYVSVHANTYDILQQAVRCSEMTDGTFDVTMQPLIERWNLIENCEVPSDDEIKQLCDLVGHHNILFQKQGFKIMLKNPKQAISLGGIAKGYAADQVRVMLKQNDVNNAIINLGGTVVVMNEEQKIGLQYPFKKRTGQIMGELYVKDKIVVTSGSYEQEYIRNGVRYHHILDPRTGYPSKSNLISVTLIGTSGTVLDALATAILVLGLEKGYRLVKEYNLQAVLVTEQLQVFATEGLQNNLNIRSSIE